MGIIINLTQHVGTPEQGVIEPADKAKVSALLTFDTIPSKEMMAERAQTLASIAREAGAEAAMIGGAPYFMAPLEAALVREGITPLYAFSVRESVEETLPGGEVRKTQVFRHRGFVRGATIVRTAIYYDYHKEFSLASCLIWDLDIDKTT